MPLRAHLVRRDRLVERLQGGSGRRLTLLSAPAGCGKTSLLEQWFSTETRRPVARAALDDDASDPVKAWSSVLHAIERVHPSGSAAARDALVGGPRALASEVVPRLIEGLEDAPPMVVVIDDWHLASHPMADAALARLVDLLRPSVQLVVSTRTDPRLPIATMRAEGQLVEVRERQLRLSVDEAQELFAGPRRPLTRDQVERLVASTEGWPAGLRLAQVMLEDAPDDESFVASFTGAERHIADYLDDEVLDHLDPAVRTFAVQTSLLERLSAPICDALLQRRDSEAILRQLERANMFLIRLDAHGDEYRFHALFRSVLRRALASQGKDQIASLHDRASRWFEEHGEGESAVEHAILSRDVARISDLVGRQLRARADAGELVTVIGWLGRLDWEAARLDPQLALVRALVAGLMGRSASEVEEWLDVAARAEDHGPLAMGMASFASGIAMTRGLFLTTDLASAVRAGRSALVLEAELGAWHRQACFATAWPLYLLGRADEARVLLTAARAASPASAAAQVDANVFALLSLIESDQGRAATARPLADAAMAVVERHGLRGGVVSVMPLMAIGCSRGLDGGGAGIDDLEQAVSLCSPQPPNYTYAHALIRLAQAQHMAGAHSERDASAALATAALPRRNEGSLIEGWLDELRRDTVDSPNESADISSRELDVLRLLESRLTQRQIASELFLSKDTIKSHTRAIYLKLGVSSRGQAVTVARNRGLI